MRKTAALAAIMMLMAFKTQEEKTYTLMFTAEEVNVIYEALGELPAKRTEIIRFKIVQQVNTANADTKKK